MVVAKPYVTFADYLEAEQSSDVKHEWFDGSIYAISRGTPEHAGLSTSIQAELRAALPRGCRVYSSDLMLYVAEAKLSTYSDGSVVCGPLETITVKRNNKSLGEAVTNPVVIVEVLSDSNERYDREEKFSYYRKLPSLQEYVLVSQDDRLIEVFRRPAEGERWTCETGRAGGGVTIHSKLIEVDAVYGTTA